MSNEVFTICTYCLRAIDEHQNPICSLFSDQVPENVEISHGLCNECEIEQRAELERFRAARAAKNLVSVS